MSDRLSELAEEVVPQRNQPALPDRRERLCLRRPSASSEITARGTLTCFPASDFGRAGISIRLRPTPIAPEETRTTLWPCERRWTTVSTSAESVESSGWCVVSCTIEDVPSLRTMMLGRGRAIAAGVGDEGFSLRF